MVEDKEPAILGITDLMKVTSQLKKKADPSYSETVIEEEEIQKEPEVKVEPQSDPDTGIYKPQGRPRGRPRQTESLHNLVRVDDSLLEMLKVENRNDERFNDTIKRLLVERTQKIQTLEKENLNLRNILATRGISS